MIGCKRITLLKFNKEAMALVTLCAFALSRAARKSHSRIDVFSFHSVLQQRTERSTATEKPALPIYVYRSRHCMLIKLLNYLRYGQPC